MKDRFRTRLTTARRMSSSARSLTGLLVHSFRAPRPRTRPLVSVIIPTYNWSSVLRHAIASVLRQTYDNFELLVIGDHCTDDSEQVVASFGDERLRWHNLEVNSGNQSGPNNAGLERARGELVAYLGHDDLWVPTHLVRLVSALERTGAAAAHTVCQELGPPGSNARMLTGLGMWRPGLTVPPSALAHRRQAIEELGGWRDYRTLVETPDQELVARLAGSTGGMVSVHALTVCKLSSGWRRDSYLLRRSDEQAEYFRRMRLEPAFVARELGAYVWLRLVKPEISVPGPEPEPEVIPPGWRIGQWRKIRGLPEHPPVAEPSMRDTPPD